MAIGGLWRTRPPVLVPDGTSWWMGRYAGASAALGTERGRLAVLVSGRDSRNRSHIGRVWIDLEHPECPAEVEAEPALAPGGRGCFDDSGVSYPSVVDSDQGRALFFTGWSRRVTTPFQNDLGLAVETPSGRFERVSRAPILPLDDADHLAIGSSFAMVEDGLWRLWYTSWTEWGDGEDDPPHRYLIKYATSADGQVWTRDDVTCIGPAHPGEHSICRPSVLRLDDGYHMWFCSRGERYQIGYAWSADGIDWVRSTRPVEFSSSIPGFDDQERAYPHVFQHDGRLLMLYSGNDYGRAGLGLAVLDSIDELGGHP